mmetsp:Transcript_38427/g.60774  ORF Transcript_38427/g.60774 Transcript_38427/m.60774 type:complete len:229 (-) Transcript_38427:1918-2604(-)
MMTWRRPVLRTCYLLNVNCSRLRFKSRSVVFLIISRGSSSFHRLLEFDFCTLSHCLCFSYLALRSVNCRRASIFCYFYLGFCNSSILYTMNETLTGGTSCTLLLLGLSDIILHFFDHLLRGFDSSLNLDWDCLIYLSFIVYGHVILFDTVHCLLHIDIHLIVGFIFKTSTTSCAITNYIFLGVDIDFGIQGLFDNTVCDRSGFGFACVTCSSIFKFPSGHLFFNQVST